MQQPTVIAPTEDTLNTRYLVTAKGYNALSETLEQRGQRAAQRVALMVLEEITQHHLTGAEISRRSGVSYSTLRRKLNGDTPFKVGDLWKIANALDATVMDLVPSDEEVDR